MIAAFAAAGALFATAWTGYYQVQTSKDQLAQSAEDSEKDLQAQAALVSSWSVEDRYALATGYFANRSLDPISQVTVGLATGVDGEVQEGRYSGPKALLSLGDVPPCSRVKIPPVAARNALFPTMKSLDTKFAIAGFTFVDARGHRWGRATNKPFQRMKLPPTNSPVDAPHTTIVSTWKLLFGSNLRGAKEISSLPAPEPLRDCGTDGK
jgi:hypothetical protein